MVRGRETPEWLVVAIRNPSPNVFFLMPKPKLKNGYTRIANELMDVLPMSGFTGMELSILLFVMRKTYGYRKKEDAISISQFNEAIHGSRRGILVALSRLKEKKVLLITGKKAQVNVWKLNTAYPQWVVNPASHVNLSARAKLSPRGEPQYTGSSEPQFTHKRKKENTKEKGFKKLNPKQLMQKGLDEVKSKK